MGISDGMDTGPTPAATWTRAGRAAALVASALVCLMVGLLCGVMAAGGRPADVLTVLRDPAAPAAAKASVHERRARTVTVTAGGTAAAPVTRTRTETVTTPASTVTVTSTVTAPTTSPTTTQAAP